MAIFFGLQSRSSWWHVQERRLLAVGDTFNRVIVWNLLTYAVDKVLQVELYGSLGEAGIDQVH